MIYCHWAKLTALILCPTVQLKLLTMCCWLHAHSFNGHFVHWRRAWLCRDSSAAAAAAACNMSPQRLPGSSLSIFHYPLFNLSPCLWTAVQFLTVLSSCQENSCPFVFHKGGSICTGNLILCGQKNVAVKKPKGFDRCSLQVKLVVQIIIRGIEFPQIRASKTNCNSQAIIKTFQRWWKYEWKSFRINQYVCQFA